MLRKSFVSVLLVLYSLSAIGVPLHFHYCKGELRNVTLFVKAGCHEMPEKLERLCCNAQPAHCNSEQNNNHCCDDDTQWLQEDLPVICAEINFLSAHPDVPPVQPVIIGMQAAAQLNPVPGCCEYLPGTAPPFYVLHCALIFYS